MAIELAAIKRSLPDPAAQGVSLGVMGVGKRPSERYIHSLIQRSPEAIVLVGFCGGSDPSLEPGDFHIARSFLSPDQSDYIDADANLNAQLVAAAERTGTRVVVGPSVTVDAIADRAAKTRLHKSTGTASVNMEDYWVAHAARAAAVPFASVRAVLDSVSIEIPGYLSSNSAGAGHILVSLMLHPSRLPSLIRLARLSRLASRSLAHCALAAIESRSPDSPALAAVPK